MMMTPTTTSSSKHNRDNTQLITTELELAKNAKTILRAATKRNGRCSSTYNLECKQDEYESRNEELTSQIAELNEISYRSQRKETKNTVTTQAEISKCKAPRINKKLETEIKIERSDTKRRQHIL